MAKAPSHKNLTLVQERAALWWETVRRHPDYRAVWPTGFHECSQLVSLQPSERLYRLGYYYPHVVNPNICVDRLLENDGVDANSSANSG